MVQRGIVSCACFSFHLKTLLWILRSGSISLVKSSLKVTSAGKPVLLTHPRVPTLLSLSQVLLYFFHNPYYFVKLMFTRSLFLFPHIHFMRKEILTVLLTAVSLC